MNSRVEKNVWPEFKVRTQQVGTRFMADFHTYIRKESNGKYYMFLQTYYCYDIDKDKLDQAYQAFITECYKSQNLYRIPEKVILDSFGKPLFGLDENQEPEEERIKRKYTTNF